MVDGFYVAKYCLVYAFGTFRSVLLRLLIISLMIPASYKPKKKFMELAIAEAKRAGDRGDYPIGAVITHVVGKKEVVIASAGNRVKTSGSSIKHVELRR